MCPVSKSHPPCRSLFLLERLARAFELRVSRAHAFRNRSRLKCKLSGKADKTFRGAVKVALNAFLAAEAEEEREAAEAQAFWTASCV